MRGFVSWTPNHPSQALKAKPVSDVQVNPLARLGAILVEILASHLARTSLWFEGFAA